MKNANLGSYASVACAMLMSACGALEHEGEHNWREEPHHVSVLLSGTIEEHEEAPSIGLDYEYRTSQFLGLGAVVERAFGDIDATTVLGVADLHITNQFIVQTGPGVEFVGGEEEAVYRLGVLYEFERGGYTVSPQVHYDWTSVLVRPRHGERPLNVGPGRTSTPNAPTALLNTPEHPTGSRSPACFLSEDLQLSCGHRHADLRCFLEDLWRVNC